MTSPQRIRLSRAKGFRLPEGTVNVARPGKWGNLFVVGQHGTRVQCAAKFYQLARGMITFSERIDVDVQMTMYRRIRRHLDELRGRDIACWCDLGGPCHGDVYLMLANPGFPMPAWMQQPVDIGRVRLGMAAWDIEKLNRRKFSLDRQAASG